MDLRIEPHVGEPYSYEATSALNLAWVADPILAGRTYPALPFLEVETVVDVGGNCGAAAIYFAQNHPTAKIHSIEPGSPQRACLERNVRGFPNVTVHPHALGDRDGTAQLYGGDGDTGLASLVKNDWNLEESEEVLVRSGESWAEEHGVDRIDVLKVDAELSELDILLGFGDLVSSVAVIYLEFGSRQQRRSIFSLLDPTHDLYLGDMTLDQGEVIFLRRDLADHPSAKVRLVEIVAQRKQSG